MAPIDDEMERTRLDPHANDPEFGRAPENCDDAQGLLLPDAVQIQQAEDGSWHSRVEGPTSTTFGWYPPSASPPQLDDDAAWDAHWEASSTGKLFSVVGDLCSQMREVRERLDLVTDTSHDEVNHPDHYGGKDNPYEAIKVIEAWGLGFNIGNAVKYIVRAWKKPESDELTDLKKALWYLRREHHATNSPRDTTLREAIDAVKMRIVELGGTTA